MRIGIFLGSMDIPPSVMGQIRRVEETERLGFDSFWFPHVFGADALTMSALAGQRTRRIEIGTAVVPTFARHPVVMAQQAMTVQASIGGRFTLGIGPSHKSTIEEWLGLSYERPAQHMREYLSVLRLLVYEGDVDFTGEMFQVRGALQVPDATPCPILLAALGPMMLRVAGELADGTVTWMTGPRTLETHVVPRINAAAEASGRPRPRICAGMPVAVTDEPVAARERAARIYQSYGLLPSYRRMLDLEGAESPADVAIIGTEAEVEQQLRDLADIGVTDLLAEIFPVGDHGASMARTQDLLGSLVGKL